MMRPTIRATVEPTNVIPPPSSVRGNFEPLFLVEFFGTDVLRDTSKRESSICYGIPGYIVQEIPEPPRIEKNYVNQE
jgi:hypothetical protein